jgi:Flp pilus assembly protein TadG
VRSRSGRERAAGERGSITAEFAVVMPAVVIVLACALGTMQLVTEQLRLQDAAAVAARTLARGDPGAAARAAAAAPGASITHAENDGLICVTATARGHGLPPLGAIMLGARSCSLGTNQ